ncbi:MAG: nicotinate-nucleotide adenylyltransferase [Gemmatimonadetes bacterium]|uniref:Probable nicotinate-nucleotide adenylyltransferase n=1 Tax=Candidatus Kutchimonas denitrificans TaxID=3056748 RepID=A0AAE5C9W7_9BACT|nr:nicotinate-nucleotide adenylyltransferase [Gemmatimonadota bacterium]NIR73892.1 nicotinate-nucleotide adenylyltransferase [Candidatus Kutchimonas denitrificans]NIR99698.1 nicotinate-nucleotide adenylyltransferase [Gemmatimonadota bacterium]NIT65283.1 nicotinate-nucleotide adenylyltransferase [Gemmatimonadota bacterium]NIW73732.1 nicotinate-nucleotide adenylyltransferase [Gemmatimonadota bacterium]
MRLGIFGGTFDPPHVGHLIVADDAAAALGLDRVLFVPAGTHPLKGDRVEAPSRLRLWMIEAATAGSERFHVDDRELQRTGPSYTVDTLHELTRENPEAELFLLVGSDILAEFDRWHRVQEITRLATVTVLSRAGVDPDEEDTGIETEFRRVEVTNVDISSTEVRERIRSGRPYRYLVPQPVYEIIEEHSLYRRSPAERTGS